MGNTDNIRLPSGSEAVRTDAPQPADPALVVVEKTVGAESDPSFQRRFDTTSSPTFLYIGRAAHGVATAAAGWKIRRITLAAGAPTAEEWSSDTAIWDNRAAEAYG